MDILMGGAQRARNYSNEAALSLHSRRSGTKRADCKGLFVKCRRLSRGFFWNSSLPFASLLVILGREVISDRKGGKGKNREKEEEMGIF